MNMWELGAHVVHSSCALTKAPTQALAMPDGNIVAAYCCKLTSAAIHDLAVEIS